MKDVKDTRNVAYGHMESTNSMRPEEYEKCCSTYLELAKQIDTFIERGHMDGTDWQVGNTGS